MLQPRGKPRPASWDELKRIALKPNWLRRELRRHAASRRGAGGRGINKAHTQRWRYFCLRHFVTSIVLFFYSCLYSFQSVLLTYCAFNSYIFIEYFINGAFELAIFFTYLFYNIFFIFVLCILLLVLLINRSLITTTDLYFSQLLWQLFRIYHISFAYF